MIRTLGHKAAPRSYLLTYFSQNLCMFYVATLRPKARDLPLVFSPTKTGRLNYRENNSINKDGWYVFLRMYNSTLLLKIN